MKRSLPIILGLVFVCAFSHAQLISGSIIVTEINYNSDTTQNPDDWFELYNKSASSVNIGGWTARDQSLTNQFTFPIGTTIGGNQRLVVVRDIQKFTAMFPGVTNIVGPFPFGLANGGDKIRLYDDDGGLKYSVTYDDTLGWPRGADGLGRTLELNHVNDDPNNPASWFDGCMFGSPGVAFTLCNPPLVFSEINYHSDTLNDSGDWVELHNRSGAAINLTGWRLRDSRDTNVFVFPVVTMPDGAYLVVYQNLAKFENIHPGVVNKVGNLGFGLSNSGEAIRLYNAQDKLQFSVRYNDKLPWDTLADGYGYTLELLSATGRMNDAGNWFAGCLFGSPGMAYDPTCGVGVEVVAAFADATVLPSPDRSAYLVLLSAARNNAAFDLFDIRGSRLTSGALLQGTNRIDVSALATGIYILRLRDAVGTAAYKLYVD